MTKITNGITAADHPHLDLSGEGDERLVVPCFSVGGPWVKSYIEAERKIHGFRDAQIFVRMDNAVAAKWNPGHCGYESYWLVGKHRRLSLRVLSQCIAGEMQPEAVLLIARGVMHREKVSSGLPPSLRKMVMALIAECEAETASSSADR